MQPSISEETASGTQLQEQRLTPEQPAGAISARRRADSTTHTTAGRARPTRATTLMVDPLRQRPVTETAAGPEIGASTPVGTAVESQLPRHRPDAGRLSQMSQEASTAAGSRHGKTELPGHSPHSMCTSQCTKNTRPETSHPWQWTQRSQARTGTAPVGANLSGGASSGLSDGAGVPLARANRGSAPGSSWQGSRDSCTACFSLF